MKYLLSLTAAITLFALPLAAQIHDRITLTPDGALAEVTSAVREGKTLTVTARFTAFDPAYDGEVIYDGLSMAEIIRSLFLKTGDRDFQVLTKASVPQIPDMLALAPYPSGKGPQVVGVWRGVFVAPTQDLKVITLLLPNMLPIGPFPIVDTEPPNL